MINRKSSAAAVALAVCSASSAAVLPVRIGCYNIDADTNGNTTVSDSAFTTVVQGIGNESLASPPRPIDILALEETTSNGATVAPLVSDLNTLYPGLHYAQSSLQLTESGNNPTTGNGPNAIIYNTNTLQLVNSVAVGTPQGSSNGYYRQEGRYEFAPANVAPTASDEFYVYVGHYKSGSGSTNESSRNLEAKIIRADALTLPSTARILYTGDLNLGYSDEAMFQTLTASGQGQGFDPIATPGVYQSSSSGLQAVLTESSRSMHYRDDFQLVTQNVLNDTTGLNCATSTYTAFGNNGSVGYSGNVASGSNTALPGLPNRSAVLTALTTLTDHLPVIADYNLVTNAPNVKWVPATGGSWNAAANWTPDWIPNSAGATANFSSGLASASSITLDGNKSVGTLLLAGGASYNVAPGTGGTLTIDNAGSPGVIVVASGSHTVSAPVYLASPTTVGVGTGANLTIAGPWTGPGPLTENVAASVVVSATGALNVPLNVGGSLTFAPSAGQRVVPSVTVIGGGNLTVAAPLTPAARSVLVTSALTIAGGGIVDLTGNDSVVRNGDVASVTAAVVTGVLRSSTAAVDPSGLTTLGVILNQTDSGQPIYGSSRPFDTYAPTVDDVLVKYTYYGDANLDGKVDGSDYSLIDAAFGSAATGWYHGDFNYDSVVDASDYTLIDNSYNRQTVSLAPTALVASAAAVPEPSAALTVIISWLTGLRRHRNRQTPDPLPADDARDGRLRRRRPARRQSSVGDRRAGPRHRDRRHHENDSRSHGS